MIRPLLWAAAGILLALLVVPALALEAAAPLLVVIAAGFGIVIVAGLRGRRLDADRVASDQAGDAPDEPAAPQDEGI